MDQTTKPTGTTLVNIKGWIHQFVSTDPDAPPQFAFFGFESTTDSCVMVQPHTIEVEVLLDQDRIVQAAVGAIHAKQKELLDDYLESKTLLDEKLAKLLALPSPKAFSADSVGGAEEQASPRNAGHPTDEIEG